MSTAGGEPGKRASRYTPSPGLSARRGAIFLPTKARWPKSKCLETDFRCRCRCLPGLKASRPHPRAPVRLKWARRSCPQVAARRAGRAALGKVPSPDSTTDKGSGERLYMYRSAIAYLVEAKGWKPPTPTILPVSLGSDRAVSPIVSSCTKGLGMGILCSLFFALELLRPRRCAVLVSLEKLSGILVPENS
jgi:hypothetical protein